jgi:hypothetical protein
MPPRELAAASVAFDSLLSDAQVSELLRRYAVQPREVFMSIGGMEVSHRLHRGQPGDSAVADARLVAIAYPQGILCHAPRRISGLLEQERGRRWPRPELQERMLRGELAEVQRLRRTVRAARAGEPIIYGVTVVGPLETLERLARDPRVSEVERGGIATQEGFEQLTVAPPPRPHGLRRPAALPAEIEALPISAVRSRLEELVREGLEECPGYERATDPPVREPVARLERSMFVCDWTPSRPAAERIIADIRLRSADGNRIPTEEDLQALRGAGARILHVFNVAMVRVEIDTGQVPVLIRGRDPIAEWAASVPDPTRHEVELQVFFARPPQEEDIRAIEALGVEVRGGIGMRGVLYVVAPDAAVPQLARLPRVTNVRAQAMICAEALGVEATPRHNPGPR